MLQTSTSPYRNNGGARPNSGRRRRLNDAEQSDLGRRCYRAAFIERREATARRYPKRADEIRATETMRDFMACLGRFNGDSAKDQYVTNADYQILREFMDEKPLVARTFAPSAVVVWRAAFRRTCADEYRSQFCA